MGEDGWRQLSADLHPEQTHYQGWYAVALSSEVGEDKPLGCDFLGGRVAVYRRSSGEPVVMTSRCPHMGADLALGDVIGDELRCTYHYFFFGPKGDCTRIPSGGAVPPGACVFSYPAVDRLGLIWAFNGEEPLFAPPEVRDYAPDELLLSTRRTNVFSVAPWLSIGNTFDFMHLRYVHGFSFDFDPQQIRWLDGHRIELEIEFESPELGRFEQRILITGTNAVSYVTGKDYDSIGLFTSTPIGSAAQTYYVAGVPKDPGVPTAELERRLKEQMALADALLVDDARVLTGIHFKVGTLVEEDQAMAKYMRWVNEFPTAAPAAAYD
jgi:phenylpropionate dioxygenase-like ring-hydroxylating dioxygenase large terminal subunit